jgi:predicted DsbA family dithiol-disulfide isomerase
LSLLKDFPEEVHEILSKNDFSNSYVWNTRDFDLLPTFHKENIVLIGDAAHLALPFTSAGTTNAIRDAVALTEALLHKTSIDEAFISFYKSRSEELADHLKQGRELKKIFLDPKKYSERGFVVPLISDKYNPPIESTDKQVKIAYFTDPICSTCWIFQSILRKLHLEYGNAIDITYHMGGLLPNWTSQQNKKIKSPIDAANLWYDLGKSHQLPIDGIVWVTDPLESSFPPSLAFKAAQLQDNDRAISFLRRMKELLFIENKNISKWEIIEAAALNSGLDVALLKKDVNGKAKSLFQQDLDLAKELSISSFPTLVVESKGQRVEILKGIQTYEAIEQLILNLDPNIQKSVDKITAYELFQRFENMTEKEFCFLLDLSIHEAQEELKRLSSNNIIVLVETINSTYWKLNSDN